MRSTVGILRLQAGEDVNARFVIGKASYHRAYDWCCASVESLPDCFLRLNVAGRRH